MIWFLIGKNSKSDFITSKKADVHQKIQFRTVNTGK